MCPILFTFPFTAPKSRLGPDFVPLVSYRVRNNTLKCRPHVRWHKSNCCSHHDKFSHRHIFDLLRLVAKFFICSERKLFSFSSRLYRINLPTPKREMKHRVINNKEIHFFIADYKRCVIAMLLLWFQQADWVHFKINKCTKLNSVLLMNLVISTL